MQQGEGDDDRGRALHRAVRNYAQYCGPGRTLRTLAQGVMPEPGAHLITPWFGFVHHGVYAGGGQVVHYGALMYDLIRKPVEEVSLARFAQGRPVFVVEHEQRRFDAREIVRRARSRLGEHKYRLLSNNCEHFVEWCLYDAQRSFQVETALAYHRLLGRQLRDRVRAAWLGRLPVLMAAPVPPSDKKRAP